MSTHRKVYNYMKQHPEYMTNENEEGVKRVETENYAYLMESTTIEYVTQRHCSLAQVGGLLDDKGYGIAMKKGPKLTQFKLCHLSECTHSRLTLQK